MIRSQAMDYKEVSLFAVATLKIICKSLDYKEVIKADFFWGFAL